MRGKLDCHGLSDVGRRRRVNEDQFLIADLSKSMLIHQTSLSHEDHSRLFSGSQGKLFLVADGMGGESAGEVASALAVETVTRYLLNTMPWFLRLQENQEDDLKDELRAALERCQERIVAEATASAERRGMGTTLTMAYIIWPRLYVVHAGDSRCYLLRGNRLEQVTTDHTVAQQLVERGVLRPEEAEGSRWSHVLWNCLGGGSSELSAEVYKATLQIGDTLLLCSDGLSQDVPEEQLLEVLRKDRGAEETCRELVDAANRAGGRDNITVVVARFRDLAHPDAAARQAAEEVAPPEVVVRAAEATPLVPV